MRFEGDIFIKILAKLTAVGVVLVKYFLIFCLALCLRLLKLFYLLPQILDGGAFKVGVFDYLGAVFLVYCG